MHLAPALVGAPDPGLLLRRLRRTSGRRRGSGRLPEVRLVEDHAGDRRARHLVLLGALAVLDVRLAGRHRRPPGVLPDDDVDHRLRHPLLLGRPDDHAGASLHRRGPVPHVFLNGLVRDEHGQKMSKTKGNVIDPLDVADEFGADAVRFTLAILSSGRDIPLAKSRMQGYAAFATKIWNAARFALMTSSRRSPQSHAPLDHAKLAAVDRWILAALQRDSARRQSLARGVPLRRGGERDLPVRLGRALRLVHRDVEAGAVRAAGDAGRAASREGGAPRTCSIARCGCSTPSCRSSPRRSGRSSAPRKRRS